MTRQEIQVRWKRVGWVSEQKRLYQSEAALEAFIERLKYGNDPRYAHLAPLEYVRVFRREVGPWQEHS